jgi:HTH-type transcriptional regulator, transcriptional repressor of NAD biosynthesis genes
MTVTLAPRAYVLMTALPPTRGHANLIRYALRLTGSVDVIVCTQPDEPYARERVDAISLFASRLSQNVRVHQLHRTLPQEPEQAVDFWGLWAGFLTDWGIAPGDYVVASETYGLKLAEITGAKFMPYDLGRNILDFRATRAREDVIAAFPLLMPEFQDVLRQRVTIFGAESAGKTTLAESLTWGEPRALWFPEWARPYLETVGSEITVEKMTDIWQGQRAFQSHVWDVSEDYAFIVQDTDLFSTVGYWALNSETLGPVPQGLIDDAIKFQSDLYILPQAALTPFEVDPLRYGGDQREADDSYWVSLCERYGLNYVVLDSVGVGGRAYEAKEIIDVRLQAVRESVSYKRQGKNYE